MSKLSLLERLTAAQKDKKVVLAEVAAVGLAAAFRKKIWEDPGANININHDAVIRRLFRKKMTASWASIYSSQSDSLVHWLETIKDDEKYHDQYQELQRLKEKLEKMGGLASEAVAQTRFFKMGEVPRGKDEQNKEIAGRYRSVRSQTPDGTPVEVDEIDIDSAHNVDQPNQLSRLRRVLAQLREKS